MQDVFNSGVLEHVLEHGPTKTQARRRDVVDKSAHGVRYDDGQVKSSDER
jgi:hypothetical protein